MGEITIDALKVERGSTIDGCELEEVTIDGCVIRFADLIRWPGNPETVNWQAVTGGGGNYSIDLSEANSIVMAGVRFRGRSPVTSSRSNSNSWSGLVSGITGTVQSGNRSVPGVPSAPYGCGHSSPTGVSGRAQVSLQTQYTLTPQARSWNYGYGPYTSYPSFISDWGPIVSPQSPLPFSAVSITSDGDGNYDVVALSAMCRVHYNRICYSADAVLNVGNYTSEFTFILSQGSLAGQGVVLLFDDSGHSFYPLPGLVAGQVNSVGVSGVRGSGNVDMEIFVIYE